jgi:hypothetical protein
MNPLYAAVPDLLIHTTGRDRALRLSGPRLGAGVVTAQLAEPAALRELHARFVDNLVRFRQRVGDVLTCTPGRAAAALVELAEAGRVFLVSVFESVADVHRVADCFRRACPTWGGGGRLRPIQIQSYGRLDEHLPWELLPIFEPRHVPVAATVADLERACRPFGAFAALVERRTPTPVPPQATLDASQGLGVRFFYHAGFPGAQAELGFLRAHAANIRLRGPYPRQREPAGPSIGQQLRDPTIDDRGNPTGLADHIVHFSCHCETLGLIADEFAFHLADEDGVPTKVSVRQLLNEIVMASSLDTHDVQLPVVFINACDSATLDPRCGTGLLTPFAKNGNLALIGTVASVPDELAASFSHRFYAGLLAGHTFGAAVFEARRHLLLQYANPLAILYCLYGNANVRVLPVLQPNRMFPGGYP